MIEGKGKNREVERRGRGRRSDLEGSTIGAAKCRPVSTDLMRVGAGGQLVRARVCDQ